MRTPAADLLTQTILAVFRANGRLLNSGDALVAPLGLTSARWQVLGAVALSDKPLSAPQVAATMGTTRQGSQKQINLLVNEGLLESLPNPTNKRSPLYKLTTRGRDLYAEIDRTQASWANQLAEGLSLDDLAAAKRVLDFICEQVDDVTIRSTHP